MQEFGDWRKSFLARRDLMRPNGEMLFAYRASKEEYLELRAIFCGSACASERTSMDVQLTFRVRLLRPVCR